MGTGLRRIGWAACAVAAAGVAALAGSLAAGATSPTATGAGVTPTSREGSSILSVCSPALTGQQHIFGLKVEQGRASDFNGSYDKTNTSHTHGNDNPLRVTIANTSVSGDTATFDWTANMPVDFVYVKAGSGATVYDYSSYGWGGNPATGPWGDTGLSSPKDSISHVLFCTIKKLRVQKTAVASFTREYTWSIDKSVRTSGDFGKGATLSLQTGGSGAATWQITAKRTGAVDSRPRVEGVITVLDSSPFDVSGVLDESLSNVSFAGSCAAKPGTDDKATFSVGKGQSITCAYSAPLGEKSDGSNSVVATSSSQEWMPSSSASQQYSFGAPGTEINKTVRWADSNGSSKAGITGTDTTTYETQNSCGSSRGVDNTVTLRGDGDAVLGKDTATLHVVCQPLQPLGISKTVDSASFKRTWTWTIDKQVKTTGEYGKTAALELDPGRSGTASYKVALRGSAADGSYVVSGTITVTNPNAGAVGGVSVSDDLPGAVVDCGDGRSSGLTLAPHGALHCTYTATSETTKPTENTASVRVADHREYDNQSRPVPITFGQPTVVNGSVDVSDAFDGGAATPLAGGSGLTPAALDGSGGKVFTYDRNLSCGSSRTVANTASVATSGASPAQLGSSDASVQITCTQPKALQVTKTAVPSFTRTYRWKVTKAADPARIELHDTSTGTSTWTVKLERDGAPVDSGFGLSGTITVANPNGFAVEGVTVTDGLGGSVTCPSRTIAASGSLRCTYSVSLESGTGGTNTATASTSTEGVPAGSASAPYAFATPTRTVNGTVDVVDSNGMTWKGRTEGFTASYPSGAIPCENATRTNTVRVIGDGGATLGSAEASIAVTCTTTPTPPTPPTPTPQSLPAPPAPPTPQSLPAPPAPPAVDIAVAKTATTPVRVGGTVTYTIVVSNVGQAVARDVGLADPAPAGIDYRSARSTDRAVRCSVSQGGQLVECKRAGSLAPRGSFVVTVVARATATGSHVNWVTVTTPGDTHAANNMASAKTLVAAPLKPPVVKSRTVKRRAPKPRPVCATLTTVQKTILVARRGLLGFRVTAAGRPVRGATIRISGPGIWRTLRTGRNGKASGRFMPARAGIIKATIVGRKGCSTARVGVIGAFEPPLAG